MTLMVCAVVLSKYNCEHLDFSRIISPISRKVAVPPPPTTVPPINTAVVVAAVPPAEVWAVEDGRAELE